MSVGQLLEIPRQFPTVKEMAGWVYDALHERDYGTLVPHSELRQILTIDHQAERRGNAAILKAARRLLVTDQKLLVSQRNVGYEIVKPSEHVTQSKATRRAAIRRLQKSALMMTHAAFDLIEGEKDRQAFVQEQVKSMLALALAKRISRRKVLPAREQIALPSGGALVKLLTKK